MNKNNGVLKEAIDKKLSEPDQANIFFSKVYGLPREKENLYRAVTGDKQVNILLVGPPATGKTILVEQIQEQCNDTIYFDASNTSGAGLIDALYTTQKAKILIIDEIDKLRKNDQNCLLGLLNNGKVEKALKENKISFQMNVKIFATSNSLTKLGKAILSRFQEYHFKEYSDEEFVKVVQFCLKGEFLEQTSEIIAKVLIVNERKNVRSAISISRLLKKNDTLEDITRVIENWLTSMTNAEVDYN